MYRNLEEHRELPIKAAEDSPQTDCVCTCKKSTEKAKAGEPAGDQTVAGLKLHWDING